MAFPHEAILVFNFFTALVDAFPYHSWPSATRDMGKCINACCEKVEHSNCLMWKSYIFVRISKICTWIFVNFSDQLEKILKDSCDFWRHTVLWWLWYMKKIIRLQFFDMFTIFVRQTTFHLEDCPKPMSFFVNPI